MSIDLNGNFTAYFLYMKSHGNVNALLSNIGIDLGLEITTQKAKFNEMAPKVVVKNLTINLDKKQSHIAISGGILEWMMGYIEKIFN